jgi:hypothetical protein
MHPKTTIPPVNPSGLCECGCGEPAPLARQSNTKLGYVLGEPKRFIRGHQRRSNPLLYVEEDRGYETPCWIWQRSTNSGGYGQVQIDGKKHPAHCWMYERVKGPIPIGLQLDHLCRVRECINPDHVEPVTQRTNVLRGESPRAVAYRTDTCIRGHAFTEENTLWNKGRRGCRICTNERRRRPR